MWIEIVGYTIWSGRLLVQCWSPAGIAERARSVGPERRSGRPRPPAEKHDVFCPSIRSPGSWLPRGGLAPRVAVVAGQVDPAPTLTTFPCGTRACRSASGEPDRLLSMWSGTIGGTGSGLVDRLGRRVPGVLTSSVRRSERGPASADHPYQAAVLKLASRASFCIGGRLLGGWGVFLPFGGFVPGCGPGRGRSGQTTTRVSMANRGGQRVAWGDVQSVTT